MDLEGLVLTKLLEPGVVSKCWDQGLREEVFEDPLNREVYGFVVDYWLDNGMSGPPTADVIQYEYPGWRPLEEVQESETWLISALKKRLALNKTQELLREAAQSASDDPLGTLNDLFESSWRTRQSLLPRASRADMSETVEQRRLRYTEQKDLGVGGVTSGFGEVDDHTRGFLPGELGAIAGYAKTGKSWFLVNAALKARESGKKPVVFTLEQSVPEFEDRFDALASGVSYGKLQRRELSFSEQKKLTESQDRLAELGSLHVEQPDRGERTVQHLVNRARQLEADFLVIDQLSFMESSRFYASKTDRYAEIIHELKEEISNTSNGQMPTLLAVQFNRGAVSTPGARGGLHQIANSSSIEQTVDIAYGLYTNKEMRVNNCMVLDILGSRRTDNKSWLLEWQLEDLTRFSVRQEYEE